MMILITGKQDSGKTTRLLEYYQSHKKGDGYVLLKQMREKDVLGFLAMRLSSGETHPFLTHQRQEIHEDSGMKIGPYLVDQAMYEVMIEVYESLIRHQVSPIYIDEIGRWELSGEGFDSVIQKCIDASVDLICTVRSEFVEHVIQKYHLGKNVQIL